MVKFFFLFIIFYSLIFSFAFNQSVQELDNQNGIMGIILETPLDSFPDKIAKGRFQGKERWIRKNERKDIDGIKIETIIYRFYEGKLHSFTVKTETEETAQQLLSWLQIFFGEGVQEGFAPKYTWSGKKVTMLYDKNLLTQQVELTVESIYMQKQFEKNYRDSLR